MSNYWKKSRKPDLALIMEIPTVYPKISELIIDSDLSCVKSALRSNIKNAEELLN